MQDRKKETFHPYIPSNQTVSVQFKTPDHIVADRNLIAPIFEDEHETILTTISDNDTVWYLRAIYKGVVGIYWTSRKHSPMYKGKRGFFLRKVIQNNV